MAASGCLRGRRQTGPLGAVAIQPEHARPLMRLEAEGGGAGRRTVRGERVRGGIELCMDGLQKARW